MRVDTNRPHVQPAWWEAFLVEMRLRGVAGSQIGAALAAVEGALRRERSDGARRIRSPCLLRTALALP